ncbi:major facilitator superfamily domain-containing protein [Aspergillus floccosus]
MPDICHEESNHGSLTQEEAAIEKQLRRKIDLMIFPVIAFTYFMNLTDRSVSLHSLCYKMIYTRILCRPGVSIFYVGYLLGQVPSNLFLASIRRPSLFLGGFIVLWGTVSALTSLVRNYEQMLACRFLLGIAETPFYPGMIFYLSQWYKKSELNFRISILAGTGLLSGAFGSLLAVGTLENLEGVRGLSSWQVFLVDLFIGILLSIILPDFPETWTALSSELRHVAIKRLKLESNHSESKPQKWRDYVGAVALAFRDPRLYVFGLGHMTTSVAMGIQNFLPTLTKTLGYSNIVSLLLVAPPYVFVFVYMLGHGALCDRGRSRFLFYVYPLPLSAAGFIMIMTLRSFAGRYVGLFLAMLVFPTATTLLAWATDTISYPASKRAVAFAGINVLGNSASIWTPMTYRDEDSPQYQLALGICAGMVALMALCGVIIRWLEAKKDESDAGFVVTSGAPVTGSGKESPMR